MVYSYYQLVSGSDLVRFVCNQLFYNMCRYYIVMYKSNNMTINMCVQVHISLAGDGYMRISWITTYKMATSVVEYGTKSGSYNEYVLGDNFSYHYYSYISGKIHYVTVGPLTPSTTYYYRVGGASQEFSFRTPPASFSAEFVFVGKFLYLHYIYPDFTYLTS